MSIFDRLFGSRPDTPIIPPVELTMRGPRVDPPDEMIPEEMRLERQGDGTGEHIAGLSFVINYEDSSGEMSLRVVTCQAVDPGPPAVLQAHCHLRGDERLFSVDNIHQIVELDTGDVMEGEELQDFLAPYLTSDEAAGESEAQRQFRQSAGPAMRILVFVAASDGHVHSAEMEVILNYAEAEAVRLRPDIPFDREGTARWIRSLKPTQAAARQAVGDLAEDADRIEAFSVALIALVRADGVIDADEADATREIVAAIREARAA